MRLFICILWFASFPVWAAPELHEYYHYYDVQGKTASQIRDQMNQSRPQDHGEKYDADTYWHIERHYEFLSDDQSCAIVASQVRVDITYLLPRWVSEGQADPVLRNKWDVYLGHLQEHENGHATNGKNAAAEIDAMLKNLAPQANCSLLEEIANQRAGQIIASHNVWDLEYDKETKHGVLQGAIFP